MSFLLRTFVIILLLIAIPLAAGAEDYLPTTVPDGATVVQVMIPDSSHVSLESDFHPGRMIVRFKNEPDPKLAAAGHTLKRISRNLPVYVVDAAKGENIPALLKAYRERSDVLYAEPDYRVQLQEVIPNDTYFLQQWSLAKLDSPEAWSIHTDSPDVVVGIVDTGVNFYHPDLQGNLWASPEDSSVHGYTCLDGNVTEGGRDDNGHGTHVSGIIAASTNNGIGIAGVNWRASILSFKAIDSSGNGYVSDVVNCLNKALELKQSGVNLRVLNHSYGFKYKSQAFEDAFHQLDAQQILSAIAAGNEGQNIDVTPLYPAVFADRSIITVTATDADNMQASFTSYGRVSGDISAPGVSVLSTYGAGYATLSGTSMATPHVAGVAVALFGMNPALTAYEARDIILNHKNVTDVDRFDNWKVWETTSGGVLNHYKALSSPLVQNPVLNNFPTMTVTPGTNRPAGSLVNLVQTAYDADGDTLWGTWRMNPDPGAIGLLPVRMGAWGNIRYETNDNQPMSFVAPVLAQDVTVPYLASLRDGNGGSAGMRGFVNILASPQHGQPPQGLLTAVPDGSDPSRIQFHYETSDPEGQEKDRDSLFIVHNSSGTYISYICCTKDAPFDSSSTYQQGVYSWHVQSMDSEMNVGELHSASWSVGTAEQAPVAVATVDSAEGVAPFTVHYDAGGSYDPDGTISHYYAACSWKDPYNEGATGSCTYDEPGPKVIPVLVFDNDGNADEMLLYVMVKVPVTSDDLAPTVSLVVDDPIRNEALLQAFPGDENGISHVEFYKNGALLSTQVVPSSRDPLQYSYLWDVTNPSTPPGTYALTATAYDLALNNTTTKVRNVTVEESAGTPWRVNGKTTLIAGKKYEFSTDGLVITNNWHYMKFQFNWGDGSFSDWVPYTNRVAKHAWPASGTYEITSTARCSTHASVVSKPSKPLVVEVVNSPDAELLSVKGPGDVYADRSLRAEAVVSNSGNLATGAFDLTFYLSEDNLVTPEDTVLGGCTYADLAPGKTVTCSAVLLIPQGIPYGAYFLGAIADPGLQVVEYDRTNNVAIDPAGPLQFQEVACLFCDDFEDGSATDWQIHKNSWMVESGDLVGSSTTSALIESPAAFEGCSLCSIHTQLQIDTAGAKLFLYGWQTDNKNRLELLADEGRDKWVLRHKANGITRKATYKAPLNPGDAYDVRIIFDGNQYELYLNGAKTLTVPKASASPYGNAGFKLKSTTGSAVAARIEGIEVVP